MNRPMLQKIRYIFFLLCVFFINNLFSQVRYQFQLPNTHYVTGVEIAGQSNRSIGLGGINLAVEDTLGIPFTNPCKGNLLKKSPLKWIFTFDTGFSPENSSSIERISTSTEYLFRIRQFFNITRDNYSFGLYRVGIKSVFGLSAAFAEEVLKYKRDFSLGIERQGNYNFTVTYKESLKTEYSFIPISLFYYYPIGEVDLGFGVEFIDVDHFYIENIVPAEAEPYSKQVSQDASQFTFRTGLGKKMNSLWTTSLALSLTQFTNNISNFESKSKMKGSSLFWENQLNFSQVTLGSRVGSVLTFTNENFEGSLICESKFINIPLSIGSSIYFLRKMLLFAIEFTVSPMSIKISDKYNGYSDSMKDSNTMFNLRGGFEAHPKSWVLLRAGFNQMNSALIADPIDAEYFVNKTLMYEEGVNESNITEYVLAAEFKMKQFTISYNFLKSNFMLLDNVRNSHLLGVKIGF